MYDYGTALHGIGKTDSRFQRLAELNPWMRNAVVVGGQVVVFPQGREIFGLEEVGGVQVGPFRPPQTPLRAFHVLSLLVAAIVIGIGGVILICG